MIQYILDFSCIYNDSVAKLLTKLIGKNSKNPDGAKRT